MDITELVKKEFGEKEVYSHTVNIGENFEEDIDVAIKIFNTQIMHFLRLARENSMKIEDIDGEIDMDQKYESFVFGFNEDKYMIAYYPIEGNDKKRTELILYEATSSELVRDKIIYGEV